LTAAFEAPLTRTFTSTGLTADLGADGESDRADDERDIEDDDGKDVMLSSLATADTVMLPGAEVAGAGSRAGIAEAWICALTGSSAPTLDVRLNTHPPGTCECARVVSEKS